MTKAHLIMGKKIAGFVIWTIVYIIILAFVQESAHSQAGWTIIEAIVFQWIVRYLWSSYWREAKEEAGE